MHDDFDHEHLAAEGWEEHESDHPHFRCTYCDAVIPQRICNHELGLAETVVLETGSVYPYRGCRCGWGTFVIYEKRREL